MILNNLVPGVNLNLASNVLRNFCPVHVSASVLHEPDDEFDRATFLADGLKGESSSLCNERVGLCFQQELNDLLMRLIVGNQDNIEAVECRC